MLAWARRPSHALESACHVASAFQPMSHGSNAPGSKYVRAFTAECTQSGARTLYRFDLIEVGFALRADLVAFAECNRGRFGEPAPPASPTGCCWSPPTNPPNFSL